MQVNGCMHNVIKPVVHIITHLPSKLFRPYLPRSQSCQCRHNRCTGLFVSATVQAIQTCFLWTRCHWCQSVHSESILFKGWDFGTCKNQPRKCLAVHLRSMTNLKTKPKGAFDSWIADSSSQNTTCCCLCHSIRNTNCLQKLVISRKLTMSL